MGPDNRLLDKKFSDVAPWTNLKPAVIKTSLLDPSVYKSTDPIILKLNTLETIDTYSSSSIHAYTDGSAFKGTTFARFRGYLKFPDNSKSSSMMHVEHFVPTSKQKYQLSRKFLKYAP